MTQLDTCTCSTTPMPPCGFCTRELDEDMAAPLTLEKPFDSLGAYLDAYGSLLGAQAAERVAPLHTPGKDASLDLSELLRAPFDHQAHVITACCKAWERQKSIILVGDCGVGKTLCAQAIAHAHAAGKNYRGLVFCPPHLTAKWRREIEETIPGARVKIISGYCDVTALDPRQKPTAPEWFIISQSVAKLGTGWRPAYYSRPRFPNVAHCVCCHAIAEEKDKNSPTGVMIPINPDKLRKKQLFCEGCGEPLWTYTKQFDRWPVATFIHRKLKGYFNYLVIDEAHQEKGDDTAQANAAGSLIAAAPKVIAMTGTLIGGYADNLRSLLWRLAPGSLVADGFAWEDRLPFSEKYGRIERRVTEKKPRGKNNSYSKGSSTRTQKFVRPGVMPTLFGEHLLSLCVFLGLEEMSDELPPLREEVIGVELDTEQRRHYDVVERELTEALKRMVAKGDKRLLGAMLMTLLGYPDRPYGWGDIGYYEGSAESDAQIWISVTEPPDLSPFTLRPKERALVEAVNREKAEGRQVWIFSTMSDKRDVLERLRLLLTAEGLSVKILRSHEVPTKEREAWIARHGKSCDVILSHPQLVETGLDLFDKGGSHNFCTLMFYLTGYSMYTLWQASLRHWRLAQTKECRTLFFFYENTMQARAMTLMGRKMAAAKALQGKFSSEGLAALADESDTLAMELAKSLVNKIDDLGAARAWQKVTQKPATPAAAVIAPPLAIDRGPFQQPLFGEAP